MNLANVLLIIKNTLNAVIPVLVSLGVVYFVWGVVAYVIAGGEEAKKKGRDRIIYGIIGLAIIVSLWGIVGLVVKTLGIGNTAPGHNFGNLCDYTSGIKTFENLAGYINCTIKDSIIPFIFAVAIAVFVWGVVKYFIINSDEEAKRTEGKQFMIWGLVAITVMLSVWGIVAIMEKTFGITIGITIGNTTGLPQTREGP